MNALTADTRLRAFPRGDLAAFESLFREHQSEVYGWIVRIVRDEAAAEDLTVETFWRIWKSRRRFDPERDFAPWARRIAGNVALSYLKDRVPEMPLLIDPAAAAEPDRVESADTRRKVAQAFEALAPKLRAVATLALIEDQTRAEIAATLGISVAAVKSRVYRAIRILRKRLSRMGVEP
jgi:RNA polymerase sigma-70 factor (ECF subfamily)